MPGINIVMIKSMGSGGRRTRVQIAYLPHAGSTHRPTQVSMSYLLSAYSSVSR